MEGNHDSGTTLYASNQNEKSIVHKKQGHGVTCGGKCWQSYSN
jgi:hypothetical protein